jgi:hypothetical protein
MSLAGAYPHSVAKAEKKGRTKAEVTSALSHFRFAIGDWGLIEDLGIAALAIAEVSAGAHPDDRSSEARTARANDPGTRANERERVSLANGAGLA